MRIKTILPFLAIALCFATCKIDRQDKLVGVWRQVPFTDPDSITTITYWTFYAGDVLEVFTIETDSSKVNPDNIVKPHQNVSAANKRGTYKRKVDVAQGDTIKYALYVYSTIGKELTISYEGADGDAGYIPGSSDIRGTYWYDELKKNKRLKMVRRKTPDGTKGGAYSRIELVKK